MIKLILLEDENTQREVLAKYLAIHGVEVAVAADIAGFWAAFERDTWHIAIIDLGLPDGDGMGLVEQLRRKSHELGIIVFTARDQCSDKIAGFAGGADQCLSKSIHPDELVAVVKALARRLVAGKRRHWTLNCRHRLLIAPNQVEISLSEQDYIVIKALVDGNGRQVRRRDIISALGGDALTYDQRRLDTQIRRLRKKALEASGYELPINTVHSAGYKFSGEFIIWER